ncbi:PREDICTED: uncharacterized protein LOC107073776 [Polistes dominula]|uniref:Uncharacterized protein LOC107073765 n=1 Tax=Polistes dominula TaxID=743375 RepID=A0ABM1JBW1_POLDO|nr:PREDICTED: uncharacterized protein LOC107073765 [Polistes dominula]XP_015189960.1 PREDICTED: uncharacterized protein LOC107073776 [Polistes dominula]
MIIVDYYYLFEILSVTLNTSDVIKKVTYVIGSVSVIFAYSYLGQKLIDNHEYIYSRLCQIPFYTLSLKTQKMLPFLIMRSLTPCNLSIKGVIVICHYVFASIMQTSFSYAMIFRNLL